MIRQFLGGLVLAAFLGGAAPTIDDIEVTDGFARASVPGAPMGAAYVVLRNTGDEDDLLLEVRSPLADSVEFHTHETGEDGIIRMRQIEGGIPLPAGGTLEMSRGGDHMMLLGLDEPFTEGGEVPLTLVFERAGEIQISIPVDLTRDQPTQ